MAGSRRGRVRRVAKWAGLVVCIVLAAVSVVSTRWHAVWIHLEPLDMWIIGLRSGALGVERTVRSPDATALYGLSSRVCRPRFREPVVWWPRAHRWGADSFEVQVPLWMPFAALAVPTCWLWYRDRRARPGHCLCGYSLTGLAPGAPCPECGKASA